MPDIRKALGQQRSRPDYITSSVESKVGSARWSSIQDAVAVLQLETSRLHAQSTLIPSELIPLHVAHARCVCICRDAILQERRAGLDAWIVVYPMFNGQLKVGDVFAKSMTFSWGSISSSIVSAVLPSRFSPRLSSTSSSCLLGHLDLFISSISTRW